MGDSGSEIDPKPAKKTEALLSTETHVGFFLTTFSFSVHYGGKVLFSAS